MTWFDFAGTVAVISAMLCFRFALKLASTEILVVSVGLSYDHWALAQCFCHSLVLFVCNLKFVWSRRRFYYADKWKRKWVKINEILVAFSFYWSKFCSRTREKERKREKRLNSVVKVCPLVWFPNILFPSCHKVLDIIAIAMK